MKSTQAVCALGVAAAGQLGAWARAPDDMQTMDSILNMDSVGDISTSGSPLLDVGNSVIDDLSSFLSGLPSQLNTWWTADPTRVNSVDSQAYENASQRVTDALNELSQFAGVPTTSYDDFTQSVLCDIVDSLNVMVDTGLADIGFDMLPYTVDNFDMSKFMGKWYQTYAGQFVIASVESNMACIESEYTQAGDSSFDLKDSWVNPQSPQNQQDSKGGSTNTAGSRTGTATETSAARFRVSYNEEFAQRCLSHGYWVLGTGPVVDGKYDWAIVSDPFNIAVRVLARDPEKFKNEYESTVLPSFQNSFPGLLHTFTPIDQSNCPARDKAAVVPVVVPLPAPPATKTVVVTMTTTTAVPMATTTTAAVTAVPLPPAAANANSEAAVGSPQPSQTPENESSNDDNNNTALAIGLGVGLGLLALILLALILFFCCYRRRRAQKAVAAVAPAKKTMAPGSDEALLKGSKTCAYCQGAQCVYGSQQEHDLARKLEHVDYAAVGNVTSADISTAAQSA